MLNYWRWKCRWSFDFSPADFGDVADTFLQRHDGTKVFFVTLWDFYFRISNKIGLVELSMYGCNCCKKDGATVGQPQLWQML